MKKLFQVSYTKKEWDQFFDTHPKIARMRRKPKQPYLIPSINHYYMYRGMKTKFGKVMVQKYLAPESVIFLEFMNTLLKKLKVPVNDSDNLRLYIKAYYSDNRRRDADNPKAIMDSMKGIVIEDDSQIDKFIFHKVPRSDKDKVIIDLRIME